MGLSAANAAARTLRTSIALVNLFYRLEVQFEGFNAITGEHDPVLASMSGCR